MNFSFKTELKRSGLRPCKSSMCMFYIQKAVDEGQKCVELQNPGFRTRSIYSIEHEQTQHFIWRALNARHCKPRFYNERKNIGKRTLVLNSKLNIKKTLKTLHTDCQLKPLQLIIEVHLVYELNSGLLPFHS